MIELAMEFFKILCKVLSKCNNIVLPQFFSQCSLANRQDNLVDVGFYDGISNLFTNFFIFAFTIVAR